MCIRDRPYATQQPQISQVVPGNTYTQQQSHIIREEVFSRVGGARREVIGDPIVRESMVERDHYIQVRVPEVVKEVITTVETGEDLTRYELRVRELQDLLAKRDSEIAMWESRLSQIEHRVVDLDRENARLVSEAQGQLRSIQELQMRCSQLELQPQQVVRREQFVDRIVDVPQVVERVVKREVDKPVYVDVQVQKIVERPVFVDVDRVVDKPVVFTREVERPIYVDKQVVVERVVDVPVDKEVIVDRVVDRPIDVPVYIEKRVEVPVQRDVYVEKEVHIDKPVHVERRVEVPIDRQVIVDKPVYVEVERQIDKPIYVEKVVERPIEVDKPIFVEKVVDIQVDKPYIVERVVDVQVDKPVFVERTVDIPVDRQVFVDRPVPVTQYVDRIVDVPVPRDVIVERTIEKPAIYEKIVEEKPIFEARAVIESRAVAPSTLTVVNLGRQVVEGERVEVRQTITQGPPTLIGSFVSGPSPLASPLPFGVQVSNVPGLPHVVGLTPPQSPGLRSRPVPLIIPPVSVVQPQPSPLHNTGIGPVRIGATPPQSPLLAGATRFTNNVAPPPVIPPPGGFPLLTPNTESVVLLNQPVIPMKR
eukprot:TRINITY_DN11595_c0_g2_i3.p1 TRINITY_DN11595_c0_g2~~TRINITY_DN11595_c0_g2_i3.p1  ORF type:complete len:610 (+),score=137.15 TRINITY_DN11595_c0_g2_i3:60-1832(+)